MIEQKRNLQKNSKYISSRNNENSQFNETAMDSPTDPGTEGGYLWRISSGLVSTTAGVVTGAVGMGVGGVKWVAEKGIDAGGALADTTKKIVNKVPLPSVPLPPILSKKDKKE